MRRVLVCGGRDFRDWRVLRSTLDGLDANDTIATVICGGASGADQFAYDWAVSRKRSVIQIFADWKAHGRAAGPRRNQRMLDEGNPDLVVAFPGGRGTADMVSRAEKARVPVMKIATFAAQPVPER